MKPSYEDNSIQFVSKPFRILDKEKTELAKIGKYMPSCTIKVCVLALRNRNPGNEWSFFIWKDFTRVPQTRKQTY